MKANELRIGNYVDIKHDEYECESYQFDFESGWNMEYIHPILLTEEWLMKFGFESDGIEWWNGVLSLGIYKDGLYYCPTEDIHYRLGKEFKYVHQLQNLHHALTDEELTF